MHKCPHCEKSFAKPFGLTVHLRRKHAEMIGNGPKKRKTKKTKEVSIRFPKHCPEYGLDLQRIVAAMNVPF